MLIVVFVAHYWATVTSNGSPYAMGPLSYLSVMLVYPWLSG